MSQGNEGITRRTALKACAALAATAALPIDLAYADEGAAAIPGALHHPLPRQQGDVNSMPSGGASPLSARSARATDGGPGSMKIDEVHGTVPKDLAGRVFQLRLDGMAARVPGDAPSGSARLSAETPGETASRQSLWMFRDQGDGWYAIKHWQNPFYTLDAYGAPTEPGSYADSYAYNGNAAQLFKPTLESGKMVLLNKNGLYLKSSGGGSLSPKPRTHPRLSSRKWTSTTGRTPLATSARPTTTRR